MKEVPVPKLQTEQRTTLLLQGKDNKISHSKWIPLASSLVMKPLFTASAKIFVFFTCT
jgi:hypothetical protein